MQTSPLPSAADTLSHDVRYALIEQRLAYLERTLRSMRAWMVARTVMAFLVAAAVIGSSVYLAQELARQLGGTFGGIDAASIQEFQAQMKQYQETMKTVGR